MTKNSKFLRDITKTLRICHQIVFQVRKGRNISVRGPPKSRPRLLTDRDTWAMERMMAMEKKSTSKQAAVANLILKMLA